MFPKLFTSEEPFVKHKMTTEPNTGLTGDILLNNIEQENIQIDKRMKYLPTSLYECIETYMEVE